MCLVAAWELRQTSACVAMRCQDRARILFVCGNEGRSWQSRAPEHRNGLWMLRLSNWISGDPFDLKPFNDY